MSRRSLVCDLSTGRVFMVPEGQIRPEHIHIANGPKVLLTSVLAEHLPQSGVLPEVAAAEACEEKLAALYNWAALALEQQVAEARRMPPAVAAEILKKQALYQSGCGESGEAQSIISAAMAKVAKTRGMRGAFAVVLNALASNAGCLQINGDCPDLNFEAMLERTLACWRQDLAALKAGKIPPGTDIAASPRPNPLDDMAPAGRA